MIIRLALVIWVVVAGAILGSTINDRAKECGGPVRVGNGALIGAIAWPVLAITAVVVDKSNIKKHSCEDDI